MSKSKGKVMKKRISITLASLLAASASLGTTAYADGEAVPGYTEKELTAYYFNNEDKGTIKALFFDDLPSIPYVSAVDYINTVLLNKDYTLEENGDGVYTISGATGSLVVDTVNDTVHFDDFEKFVTLRTEREDKLPDFYTFGDFELVSELHPTDLDLSAYSIDLQSVDGEVYFPLPLLSDMFSCTLCLAAYVNDSVYFFDPYHDDNTISIDYSEFVDSAERSEDMAEYSYNELCFVIDNIYGNPERTVLHDSIEEKGLDRTLAETSEYTAQLRETLHSTDKAEYYKGIYYLDSYLFDGGHTLLSFGMTSLYSQYPESAFLTEVLTYIGSTDSYPEIDPLFVAFQRPNGSEELKECKAAAFTDDIIVKEWEDCFYSEYGDTGIFSFDAFDSSIIQPFHESLELAKEHGIRNYVLDLTTNGGGDSGVASYIFNIMMDRDYITYVSHISGNVFHDHVIADKNLDGVFDGNDDDISYDFNFAVLSSHISFSSANAISVFAKDEGVALLGENSGGGSCCVFYMTNPDGIQYAMSGDLVISNAYGEDVDLGVAPDYVLYKDNEDGSRDYSGMYDFAQISADIHEYYGDTIENNNEESIDENSETIKEETTDESTDNNTGAVTVSPDADTPVSSPATGNLNISVIAAFAAVSLISAAALRKK